MKPRRSIPANRNATSIFAAPISSTWRITRHITFRSKRIEALGAENFKLTGDLTIRGVTKEVTFDVEGPTASVKDPWGNVRAGVTATAKINRKDFGLVWNALTEAGGVVVGDEVKITIEAELIQQAPAA